jgi:copper chaperone NosL
LIGTKVLLNFTAFSGPDIGGWIFIGIGVLLGGLVFYEWRKSK